MLEAHELDFEMFSHPPYHPNMDARNYFIFYNLKRSGSRKKFSDVEAVIAETEIKEVAKISVKPIMTP